MHYILAKMLLSLSEIPGDWVKFCIFDAVFAELKAFPEWNTEIWRELITPLPNDILLSKEKEEFMKYIDETKETTFYVVKRANEALQKLISTIYKRMTTASKRKEYRL